MYEPGSTFKVVPRRRPREVLIGPTDLIAAPLDNPFGSRIIYSPRMECTPFIDVTAQSSMSGDQGRIKWARAPAIISASASDNRLRRLPSRTAACRSPARLDPSALASISMGYQSGHAVQMRRPWRLAHGGELSNPRGARVHRNGTVNVRAGRAARD